VLAGFEGADDANERAMSIAVATTAGLQRRRVLFGSFATLALSVLSFAPPALADDDAITWLERAAAAAKQLNYVGTIVYEHGGRVETSRLVHLNDAGGEFEKLTNLDGPAREVIRSHGEVRCYYPDAKIVRIEPRTFRNAFPSLSPQQLRSLAEFYDFRKAEAGRVAGWMPRRGCSCPRMDCASATSSGRTQRAVCC
jgi:sigma-E factor negative regulatory protein RseB